MKIITKLLPSLSLKLAVVSMISVQAIGFLPSVPTTSRAYAAEPAALVPSAPTAAPATKATWVWYTAEAFKNLDVTFNQMQANGINLVYLQQDVDIPNDKYAAFIKRANSLGIEVHALAGEPNWVLPEKQIKMYKFIDWVKNYNLSVKPDERYKGIHLDVEPFTTKEWRDDQDKMLGYWRDTVTGFVQETKLETGLPTGADIPFWLHKFTVPDGHGGRYTLSKFMISQFDITTLMAYRDNTREIIDVASNELNEAEALGKPLLLSVETLQNPDSFITFYGKGKKKLNMEMGDLNQNLKNRKAYKGYAVHEFSAWTKMED
ncbi:hypothetical protein O9H85_30580 [Paenibacillus filicis]|uniref:Amidase n=1 Tax=Paenibacillus gyeongsangnamensis TaxID=3388067 RepID=A0ABT4QIZ0_9BACL|nr:hypothetical protein [Paenibacillus filicis]MCZ8516655.1 hypothetical protein [Paenibacillus filicis]